MDEQTILQPTPTELIEFGSFRNPEDVLKTWVIIYY